MASDLYQSYGTNVNNSQVHQSPREMVMQILQSKGIQLPNGIDNNPNAIFQYLMQSGTLTPNNFNS